MQAAQLLLLSSSKAGNSSYLAPCLEPISSVVKQREVLFIPYAGVTMSYSDYTTRVRAALAPAGIKLRGIEDEQDPQTAIQQAEVIMVGGGNTFHLLHQLYKLDLLESIRSQVQQGIPYIGWSAGSNIAGLSIRTTNDMPIIEPASFQALQLLPFQLNPHYSDYHPPGFHGETRDQRLAEFMALDPDTAIVGIPEGTWLGLDEGHLKYQGKQPGYLFLNSTKTPIVNGQDCSELLKPRDQSLNTGQ